MSPITVDEFSEDIQSETAMFKEFTTTEDLPPARKRTRSNNVSNSTHSSQVRPRKKSDTNGPAPARIINPNAYEPSAFGTAIPEMSNHANNKQNDVRIRSNTDIYTHHTTQDHTTTVGRARAKSTPPPRTSADLAGEKDGEPTHSERLLQSFLESQGDELTHLLDLFLRGQASVAGEPSVPASTQPEEEFEDEAMPSDFNIPEVEDFERFGFGRFTTQLSERLKMVEAYFRARQKLQDAAELMYPDAKESGVSYPYQGFVGYNPKRENQQTQVRSFTEDNVQGDNKVDEKVELDMRGGIHEDDLDHGTIRGDTEKKSWIGNDEAFRRRLQFLKAVEDHDEMRRF